MLCQQIIHVRLSGGIGNQLFQLAVALQIRDHSANAPDTAIYLYTHYLNKYSSARECVLKSLFEPLFFRDTNIYIQPPWITCGYFDFRFPRFFGGILPSKYVSNNSRVLSLYVKANIYVDGSFVWQLSQPDYDRIFAFMSSYLFSYCGKLSFNTSNTCVIHIRGTDFLQLGLTKPEHAHYYIRSLMKLREVNPALDACQIVTDDIPFASTIARQLQIDCCFACDTDVNDFLLLASSMYRIIPASSFSMWACAIGPRSKKPVTVCPLQDIHLPGQILF